MSKDKAVEDIQVFAKKARDLKDDMLFGEGSDGVEPVLTQAPMAEQHWILAMEALDTAVHHLKLTALHLQGSAGVEGLLREALAFSDLIEPSDAAREALMRRLRDVLGEKEPKEEVDELA